MALLFLASDNTFLEVFVVTKGEVPEIDLTELLERLEQIFTIVQTILGLVGVPIPPVLSPASSIINTAGLVGQWDLNNTVADSSPDGTDNNSGILTGSTAFVANADFGNTLRFEGNGYLEIPNTEDINLGNHAKRTVTVWFNATDSQPRQTIFEEGGVVRGLNIYLDQGKVYFGGWNEPDNETAWKGTFLSADLSDGWHLATLTLDATLWKMKTEPNTFKAYLDGQEIGKGSGSQLWGHGDPTAFGAVVGG